MIAQPQISGIHRALPTKANQSGAFRTLLLANSMRQLTREVERHLRLLPTFSSPSLRGLQAFHQHVFCSRFALQLAHEAFTRQDLDNIRCLSKERDVLQQLARSLAPSICGHEHEKVIVNRLQT